MGLTEFATFDDASSVKYPQFLRRSEDEIKHLQRHFSKKLKGSRRRHALGHRLARLHLRIRRQREDFQNKLVHRVFAENDVLVLEKLNVPGLLKNHSLAKSISDASWSSFAIKAVFKSELFGEKRGLRRPMGHDPVLSLVSSLGPQGYRNARARLSQLRRGNSTRRQLGASHQKAWHPESPAHGQWVVTRRARASALPKGDGKPER